MLGRNCSILEPADRGRISLLGPVHPAGRAKRSPTLNMAVCDPNARVIQVIEPDSALTTSTVTAGVDQSLDESGSEPLIAGQVNAQVTFQTPKATDNYRFEYLYVDAFGLLNPDEVAPVPVNQTVYGFTVDLTGATVLSGYVLRWRVVVAELAVIGPTVDAPETVYLQLPQANIFTVFLSNPRSATDYHFLELRVENLIDGPTLQTPILVQVVAKTPTSFTVGLSPTPPSNNYFLAAKVVVA
jgi:hypothetical protein